MNLSGSLRVVIGLAALLGGAGCAHESATSSLAVKPGTWGVETQSSPGRLGGTGAGRGPGAGAASAPVAVQGKVEEKGGSTNAPARKWLRAGDGERAASQLKPAVPAVVSSRKEGDSEGPVVRLGSDLRGQIQTLNQAARYVVLRFPLGVMPAKDTFMDVVRGGVKVGEVRVTGPQKDHLTVADILVGVMEVGDEVRAQPLP